MQMTADSNQSFEKGTWKSSRLLLVAPKRSPPRLDVNLYLAQLARSCRLGAEGIVSKKVDRAYQSGPCRVWIKVRNPAPCSATAARFGIREP
jgi:hypothetical protein